jgi:hypothetical protein
MRRIGDTIAEMFNSLIRDMKTDTPKNISASDVEMVRSVLNRLESQLPTASVFDNPLRNYLVNGGFRFWQRQAPTVAATRADDTYGADRWYILTQSNPITTVRTTGDTTSRYACRLTQSNASAQRIGQAQIIEASESIPMRGMPFRFQLKLNTSDARAIRYAVLEWSGTADAVTSDVVNDWTSTDYSAGGFFNSATLLVNQVGGIGTDAAVWGYTALGGVISSTCNNIIVIVWTEATAAQNVTVDIAEIGFYFGQDPKEWQPLPEHTELILCQRRYCKTFDIDVAPVQAIGSVTSAGVLACEVAGTGAEVTWNYPVSMAGTPTITSFNPTQANADWRRGDNGADGTFGASSVGVSSALLGVSSATDNNSYRIHLTAEIEL